MNFFGIISSLISITLIIVYIFKFFTSWNFYFLGYLILGVFLALTSSGGRWNSNTSGHIIFVGGILCMIFAPSSYFYLGLSLTGWITAAVLLRASVEPEILD